MFSQENLSTTLEEVQQFFLQPNAYRAILILIVSMLAAWWLSHFIAIIVIKFIQLLATWFSKNESEEEKSVRMRQVETYLSVAIAALRALVVAVAGYLAWRILLPTASSSVAAIGAGTFFVVFAGQTVGILLRDITAGTTMIVEKWFNVGDFVKIEPFSEVAGIVEKFTLRSTKIRSLNGESIWVHNQQIMAVHVTPKALRTMAVDVFVHNRAKGEAAIQDVISAMPTGPTLLARPLRIRHAENWDDNLWRITVTGQVPPGREWLIDKFFVNALKDVDANKKHPERLFVHEPIARYTDADADKRFRQAVRIDKSR